MVDTPPSLQGVRVLIVEDEALVSMLVEDMLSDEGCEVVGAAARVDEALNYVTNLDLQIDVAILDLNLGGENTFGVAAALARRNIPFTFATGYGAGGLPPEWRDRPTLQKPFTGGDVSIALGKALGHG